MKKLLILSIMLFTCSHNYHAQAQLQKKSVPPAIAQLWKDIEKSKNNLSKTLTVVKKLAEEKVVYRTKIIEVHDTAWRIDTCISVFTPIDSATIAIMFKMRETPKLTKVGKVIRYIFNKKKKLK